MLNLVRNPFHAEPSLALVGSSRKVGDAATMSLASSAGSGFFASPGSGGGRIVVRGGGVQVCSLGQIERTRVALSQNGHFLYLFMFRAFVI